MLKVWRGAEHWFKTRGEKNKMQRGIAWEVEWVVLFLMLGIRQGRCVENEAWSIPRALRLHCLQSMRVELTSSKSLQASCVSCVRSKYSQNSKFDPSVKSVSAWWCRYDWRSRGQDKDRKLFVIPRNNTPLYESPSNSVLQRDNSGTSSVTEQISSRRPFCWVRPLFLLYLRIILIECLGMGDRPGCRNHASYWVLPHCRNHNARRSSTTVLCVLEERFRPGESSNIGRFRREWVLPFSHSLQ